MKNRDVVTMLTQTGLPFTYWSFPEKEAPSLPYIIFFYSRSENFPADDKVYQRIDSLNIELYTENKFFLTEENIEAVLDEWGFVWDKTETYLNTEHMYEVIYEMEIVIDGKD